MITYIFLLIVGFILLVKGADFFVSGSSSIARFFNIPTFIIGLTVVAFGTSLPEAAVSISAALKGANGIAIGNVLGSNIFNLLMVLGFSAVIKACPVKNSGLKFEYPLSILAAVLIIVLAMRGGGDTYVLSHVDGIIILAFFGFFLVVTVRNAFRARKNHDFLEHNDDDEDNMGNETMPLPKSCILTAIGVAGIIFGGNLVVNSATDIAETFGIDETLIGLTIVAMGTSLPELVTSMVAAFKNETDIAVGNVIGSNIFNILFVLGASVTIHPVEISVFSLYDAAILIVISLIVLIPMVKKKSITRMWGIVFILIYAAYLAYIIMRTM